MVTVAVGDLMILWPTSNIRRLCDGSDYYKNINANALSSRNYNEGENMVSVLDFKKETGMWHSILASVLSGMHVIFIPYALIKVNPASWIQMITKHKPTVAVAKSHDLHSGLQTTKDHKDITLSPLRLLLIRD